MDSANNEEIPVGGSLTGDMAKRAFDIVCSVIGLIVLAPLLCVLALVVKIGSNGPVFYRPPRSGRGGVPFRIWKYRTMVVNADKIGGGSTAKDDPRVTKVGGFLRKYKLDELPQLINVLVGEMSLVGPRPELPQYTALYEGDEKLILSVRPGITDYASIEFADLAAVLGSDHADRVYEEQIFHKKNALRLKYVRERSFAGDIVLIFRTLIRIARK